MNDYSDVILETNLLEFDTAWGARAQETKEYQRHAAQANFKGKKAFTHSVMSEEDPEQEHEAHYQHTTAAEWHRTAAHHAPTMDASIKHHEAAELHDKFAEHHAEGIRSRLQKEDAPTMSIGSGAGVDGVTGTPPVSKLAQRKWIKKNGIARRQPSEDLVTASNRGPLWNEARWNEEWDDPEEDKKRDKEKYGNKWDNSNDDHDHDEHQGEEWKKPKLKSPIYSKKPSKSTYFTSTRDVIKSSHPSDAKIRPRYESVDDISETVVPGSTHHFSGHPGFLRLDLKHYAEHEQLHGIRFHGKTKHVDKDGDTRASYHVSGPTHEIKHLHNAIKHDVYAEHAKYRKGSYDGVFHSASGKRLGAPYRSDRSPPPRRRKKSSAVSPKKHSVDSLLASITKNDATRKIVKEEIKKNELVGIKMRATFPTTDDKILISKNTRPSGKEPGKEDDFHDHYMDGKIRATIFSHSGPEDHTGHDTIHNAFQEYKKLGYKPTHFVRKHPSNVKEEIRKVPPMMGMKINGSRRTMIISKNTRHDHEDEEYFGPEKPIRVTKISNGHDEDFDKGSPTSHASFDDMHSAVTFAHRNAGDNRTVKIYRRPT